MVNQTAWEELHKELNAKSTILVAVSKTKPISDIKALYELGQRDFGENYVQELVEKQPQLPADIRWHYIGHLQTNKVKSIAPFVHLIHAVDSFKLLLEINKQAIKNNRIIDVLLQVAIADEDTKFGMGEQDITTLLEDCETQQDTPQNIRICGLMGMATNTGNEAQVHAEFARLHNFFLQLAGSFFKGKPYFSICSIGMSADYKIALQEGGNMVRIGSLLFGSR